MSTRTLVVGVDIGLTGTGVAFAAYPTDPPSEFQSSAQIIQEWPPFTLRDANKVPTVVAYREGKVLKKWGFECDPDLLEKEWYFKRKDYFKLYLDEHLRSAVFEGMTNAPTQEDIRELYRIFLARLYHWIEQTLQTKFIEYKRQPPQYQVKYIFSVSSTWIPDTTAVLSNIVKETGFENLPNQTAEIGLTEAEAAAVYCMTGTVRELILQPDERSPKYLKVGYATPAVGFSVGEALVVVDAGGGTTDVTVLEVKSHKDDVYRFDQLLAVEGEPIGSVEIDKAVRLLMENRLNKIKPKPTLKHFTMDKAIGAFQDIKHEVGTPKVDMNPEFAVKMLDWDQNHPDDGTASIKNGEMRIKIERLHGAFDLILDRIVELIDMQLKQVDCKVSYIILSGGLGSSKYVAKHLHRVYSSSMKLFAPNDPQLAVCKGLVIDRLHKLANNIPMIVRKCRASYGILYDEPYDKATHKQQKPWRNPLDGKDYAKDQIKWLIDKDARITEQDGMILHHETYRHIPYDYGRTMEWKETITRFSGPLTRRPTFRKAAWPLGDGGTRDVEVEVAGVIPCAVAPGIRDSRAGAIIRKHKHWFRIGSAKYWKIKYEIRLRIGPADIGCALWYMNEQIGEGEYIKVDWEQEDVDRANGVSVGNTN